MSRLRSLRVLGVRVNQRGDWLLRLETDDGHVGYGEVSQSWRKSHASSQSRRPDCEHSFDPNTKV